MGRFRWLQAAVQIGVLTYALWWTASHEPGLLPVYAMNLFRAIRGLRDLRRPTGEKDRA